MAPWHQPRTTLTVRERTTALDDVLIYIKSKVRDCRTRNQSRTKLYTGGWFQRQATRCTGVGWLLGQGQGQEGREVEAIQLIKRWRIDPNKRGIKPDESSAPVRLPRQPPSNLARILSDTTSPPFFFFFPPLAPYALKPRVAVPRLRSHREGE